MHFSAAAAALFAGAATAHYNFESLIVNGEIIGQPYQYVRKTKNSNGPIQDVSSPDIICNKGGIDDEVMAATETYTVAAGDKVGFKMRDMIGHPGPLAVYLSLAPDSAKGYKGDGDWFKVYESSLSNRTSDPMQWAPFIHGGVQNFTFTLPNDLPPGEYLMRGEHIALHSADLFQAQFYMGCAQIKVTGSGSGTPAPTVKFPGAYDPHDPGILVNMYWPPLRYYTPPGPVTWPTPCDDSTVNVLGAEDDGDCTPFTDDAKGDPPIGNPAGQLPYSTSTGPGTNTKSTSVAPSTASSQPDKDKDKNKSPNGAPVASGPKYEVPKSEGPKKKCKSKRRSNAGLASRHYLS